MDLTGHIKHFFRINFIKNNSGYAPIIIIFASKNNAVDSFFDGIGMGLRFTVALTVLGLVREFLGGGTLFGIAVLPEAFPDTLMMIMSPGAFLTLGVLMAILNYFTNKKSA